PAPVSTDVAALVSGVVEAARLTEMSRAIEVRAELAGGLGEASIDPDLVRAALENLVRNALEAIDESGQGSEVCVVSERRFARGRQELVIEVIDDGPGMDPRTLERAEDAFFTTKAGGSGLGLAFVRRVADAHGGELGVETRAGRGTTVRLVIPTDAR